MNTQTLIILISIIVVAFIGMVVAVKRRKRSAKALPVAIALFLLILVCTGIILFRSFLGPEGSIAFRDNELKYTRSGAIVLGRRLADKHPGGKALIIAAENYQANKRQLALIAGLKEGFADKVTIKTIESPRPDSDIEPVESSGTPKETDKPQPYLVHKEREANQINIVIDTYPDCNIIILLVELPRHADKLYLWQGSEEERPTVVLVFPARPEYLYNAIAQGYVWVLTYKPDFAADEQCPSDSAAAFKQRYVILDKENVADFLKEYEGFFKNAK